MADKKGFTIIEVLIIIAVISIIAVIGVPNYIKSMERAKSSQAIANLKIMRDAEISYFIEKNFFTIDFINLQNQLGTTFSLTTADWAYSAEVNVSPPSFLISATRNTGIYKNNIITLDQNASWGGTYPRNTN